MDSLIFTAPAMPALLAGALTMALLYRFGRRKVLWGLGTGLCAVFAILTGLVMGLTLLQLLQTLLLPAAICLSGYGNGGSEDEL